MINSLILTFHHYHTETTDFVSRCPQNRIFRSKGLSVQALEVTKQVLVEDLGDSDEDLLCLYFEANAGEVDNVALNKVEQTAIITFKDHKGSTVIIPFKCKGFYSLKPFLFARQWVLFFVMMFLL